MVSFELDGGYVKPPPGGDILTNPEVLPTGRNIHGFDPFRILLLLLTASATAFSAGHRPALIATLVLNATGWCAYRLARRRISPNGWRFGLLPLKYPGFLTVMAFALGDVIPVRLAVAAATTYVCASGYELIHDGPARVGGAS